MTSITNISLTDSGASYTAIPTITIPEPTAPIAPAKATVSLSSDKKLELIFDSGGYYYDSTPSISITNPTISGTAITDDDSKFGTYSIAQRIDANADPQTILNFSEIPDSYHLTLSFWLKYNRELFSARNGLDIFNTIDSDISLNDTIRVTRSDDEVRFAFSYRPYFNSIWVSNSISTYALTEGEWYYIRWRKHHDIENEDSYRTIQVKVNDTLVLNRSTLNSPAGRDRAYRNFKNLFDFVQIENYHNSGDVYYKQFLIDDIKLHVGNILDDSIPAAPQATDHLSFEISNPNVTLTSDRGRVTAITVVDSGLYQYNASTPIVTIDPPAGAPTDFQATAVAVLDSASGRISDINIIDSGCGYIITPSITIADPTSTLDNFIVGETVTQTLSSGVVISGEVVKYSDSDNKIHLVHVGADDGNYHTFVTNRLVTGQTSGISANVLATAEENQISNNEQNDDFSTLTVDFLDFTEDNPFGDPENN